MWRTTFILLMTLSGIICALVFWQWHVYSQPLDEASEPERANQHIAINSDDNQLTVTQTFTDLKAGIKYNITVPSSISTWTCGKEGSFCDMEAEHPFTVKTDSSGELFFQTTIPITSHSGPLLLQEWLIQISSIQINFTEVKITESLPSNGTWVVGLPLQGWSTLELIQFYVYKGTTSYPAIYRYPRQLEYAGKDKLGNSYFYDGEAIDSLPVLKAISILPDFSRGSVIYSNNKETADANGITFVTRNKDEKQIERQLLQNYIRAKRNESSDWMDDFFVSVLLNENSSNPKIQELVMELTNELGAEKLSQLTLSLLKQSNLSAKNIDSQLSKVLGKKTNFFYLNSDEKKNVVPLYYEETKELKTSSGVSPIQLIHYHQEKLYPFQETLTYLGYKVEMLSDNETILLTKGLSSYRFYVGQNIFILNEEDYGLLESPLTVLNGKIYMKEQWITSLFKVDIAETEKTVIFTGTE